MIEQVETPLHQVYVLSSLLSLKREDEQRLLGAASQAEALQLVHDFLTHEVQVLEVRQKIADQAQSEMSREQREYLLRKQLRAIQEELGDKSPEQADVDELRRQLEEAKLPEEARKEADRELKRLERLPAAAPDYQVTRSYLELLAELPWSKLTDDDIDLQRAARDPGSRSLWLAEGQGADPGIPGRDEAQSLGPGAHPLFRRTAGRRQDVAGQIDRRGDRPGVRPRKSGGRLRRSGTARTSTHLHRGHARTNHPGDSPRRRPQSPADAGRSRQVGTRLPRRSGSRPAGDPRSRPEQSVSRQLPQSALRSVASLLHRHRQHAGHDPATAAGSRRDPAGLRIQRRRKTADRPPLSAAPSDRRQPVCSRSR